MEKINTDYKRRKISAEIFQDAQTVTQLFLARLRDDEKNCELFVVT